jgi:predicted Zn-dependent protease
MSPMTVRWKPLLILSGLFLVIAVMGVMAMALFLPPSDSLPRARGERAAGHFQTAEILYRQALQRDGKNPKLLEEVADLYAAWAEREPAEQAKYRGLRLKLLIDAAKYGKQRPSPRRQLLADAILHEETVQAHTWAKELLPLDPNSADAHYVLAEAALANNPPNLEEARRHLAALGQERPRRLRTDWLRARLAQEARDEAQLEEILASSRSLALQADTDPVDGLALLRLRALDAQRARDLTTLEERVRAVQAGAARLAEGRALSALRVAQISQVLEKVQEHIAQFSARAEAGAKAKTKTLSDSVDQAAEAAFQKALDAGQANDLRVYQAYAEHLLARGKRQRCLDVVDQALKLPVAELSALRETMLELRAVAIKAALADAKDPKRFDRAAPYIKDLIDSKITRYEGLGHLFQGAIDLERSGLAESAATALGAAPPEPQLKLRESALGHLKIAAEQLPTLGAAQALYGIALIQSQEPALGRQYLQAAGKLGQLEPRYQIWMAWSMVQAGYPEEAEPIVTHLSDLVRKAVLPGELAGTLHLLRGEIHQARRTPADLKIAQDEFEKAVQDAQVIAPAVQLRLAQIEALQGQHDKALARINRLRAAKQGGPAAEHLAVLTLMEQKKTTAARQALDAARQLYPRSGELAALDAALWVKAGKPEQADQILKDFLDQDPDNVNVAQLRARLLSEQLHRDDQARALLNNLVERSRGSAPLVQLALFDLEHRNYDAVARAIEKIRARWKEAAAADLLEAQLAVARGNLRAASEHFEDALKKDPENKVVQFAKAQLESQVGDSSEATRILEGIAQAKPVKELSEGLSLMTAAEAALAAQNLSQGHYDEAIHRLEDLLKAGGAGELARPARWQLVAARAAKGEWAAARREIAALLNDPKSPPTPEERVQAANLYRTHGDDKAALTQLDTVLKADPAFPAAVVVKAYMLTTAKPSQAAAAGALLRRAIAAAKEPPAVFYLMLAAIENITSPETDALKRALAAVEQGLAQHPDSLELAQAKYRILRLGPEPTSALAFLESRAQADKTGAFRRLLVDIYRETGDYAKAETIVRSLLQQAPKDGRLAATLVDLVAARAVQAGQNGDRARERTLNDETAALIKQFRAKFPTDPAFLQAECQLAVRRGDLVRGIAIAEELDQLDKNSPVGPLLRAGIYEQQHRTSEAAKAYREALARNPRQPAVRLALAQTCLTLGDADETLAQTRRVLEADSTNTAALLLRAKALAASGGTPSQAAAKRAQAIQELTAALRRQPKFADAYHLIAEIQQSQNQRKQAVATLREGLKAIPDDANGLALLIQLLTEPRDGGQPPPAEDLGQAKTIAEQFGGKDDKGHLCLAIAVGYHKANQLDLALPWSEKAASKLTAPLVHLNYGDLLLSMAERTADHARASQYYEQALAQYDYVLKVDANSVAAINNKAWILHSHFAKNQEALELARGLMRRVDPSTLPGEFFDTLGAIQEAMGKVKDAEESYAEGLRRSREHPVLNYHMGRLLASDKNRAGKARTYLERAQAANDRLPAAMAAEVDTLLRKVGH